MQSEVVLPMYVGACFDIWEPDAGIPYAYAQPDDSP